MKDSPDIGGNDTYNRYDDYITLVEIYLTIKRNGKLFLSVVFLTFLCSVLFAYIAYRSDSPPSDTPSEILDTTPKVEYSLWLEIGELIAVNSRRKILIDEPNNAAEKLKNIYAAQAINDLIESGDREADLSSVSVDNPDKSYLIVLKIIGEENNSKSYEKLLNKTASYLIDEHNSKIVDVKYKFNYQPTRIVQQFKMKLPPSQNKDKDKSKLFLIPALGMILGILFGFLAIFIKGFLRKVRETEERD